MNSFTPIDPKLIDVILPPSGYPPEREAEDSAAATRNAAGDAARDFPDSLWIEPKDWAAKARENDEKHTWPINYIDRFTNQGPSSHECTCHSFITNCTGARNRARGIIFPDGPKKGERYEESKRGSVWLSPLSVYSEANPREWGGANVRQVMEIGCKRGILPDKIQPFDYGFKHTLQGTSGEGNSNQSGGDWVKLSQFPEGWKDTAKLFKPDQVIFADEWEQVVCLLLHGRLYSVGRNGHAIPYAKLQFSGNSVSAAPYVDSYNIVRADSVKLMKSSIGGGFAVDVMTQADDWMKPAA